MRKKLIHRQNKVILNLPSTNGGHNKQVEVDDRHSVTETNHEKPARTHSWTQFFEMFQCWNDEWQHSSESQSSSVPPYSCERPLMVISACGSGQFGISADDAALTKPSASTWTGCEVCVVNSSCILPCSFQSGQEVVIHWIYLGLPDGRIQTTHSGSGVKNTLIVKTMLQQHWEEKLA